MLDQPPNKKVAETGEPGTPRGTLVLQLPASGEIVRLALVVIGLVAFAILAWQIKDVLLLGFAAILVAVALRSFAQGIARITGWTTTVALAVAIVAVAAFSAVFVVFLGGQLVAQASQLIDNFPSLLDTLGERIGVTDLGNLVIGRLNEWLARPGLVDSVLGITATAISVAANLIVAITAGIYLAFRPGTYSRGILRLVPRRRRRFISKAFDEAGTALGHWLRGQLTSMLLVGVLTGVGLWILGLPSALALGVVAGLLEFIPYAGPFLAAAPALLIALADGGSTVFWVAGIFFVVQQLEGNVITPLIQQRVADLPPVVAILSLVAMGVAFGPLGILVAIPVTIVAMVFVTRLYVKEALHDSGSV